MLVDLNAARAARAAARGAEPNILVLGVDSTGTAKQWNLKAEMPIHVVSLLTTGNLEAAWRAMLEVPADFDAMIAAGVDPSTDDLMQLVEDMAGVATGNSSASTAS